MIVIDIIYIKDEINYVLRKKCAITRVFDS